jgi:hypothetical protein
MLMKSQSTIEARNHPRAERRRKNAEERSFAGVRLWTRADESGRTRTRAGVQKESQKKKERVRNKIDDTVQISLDLLATNQRSWSARRNARNGRTSGWVIGAPPQML